LIEDSTIDKWFELYRSIGYTVIKSSAVTGMGLDSLKEGLKGSNNLLWGHSGVGKSSLLNKIYPGLNLDTGEISSFTDKGTHTTVTSIMLKLEENTYVVDTPGIREIDPFGIRKEDLCHYFIEFLPFLQNCRFNRCIHFHEPDCAVIKAVENEEITIERYDSYLRILKTIEEDIIY
jgi:ribosome biogenesis GTPase